MGPPVRGRAALRPVWPFKWRPFPGRHPWRRWHPGPCHRHNDCPRFDPDRSDRIVGRTDGASQHNARRTSERGIDQCHRQRGRDCAILNLELGPVNLNLLGLEVILDDCEGGPVLVDITARRGQLLGNLLCGLLHGGDIDLGDLLGDILNSLQAGR